MQAGRERVSPVKPAMLAFLILGLSFALARIFEGEMVRQLGRDVPVLVFALGQGILAAMMAFVMRMAWWWRLILCFFPLAVVVARWWSLPSWVFLAFFLVLMMLYWTTFRSQVPYYPSRLPVWQAVSSLLPPEKSFKMVDVGSGFGGIVRYLSEFHTNGAFTGVEVAPLPWFVGLVRAKLSGCDARFIRGNYTAMRLDDYDVVFAYLSPAAMPSLWRQARKQMKKGSLLLSYEFIIPDVKPDIRIKVGSRNEILYGWRM